MSDASETDKLDTFDSARMKALKEYASLEFELCRLFVCLLRAEHEIASAIFYQINAARTRHAIISSLLDIRYRDTFKKPWPKLEGWLNACDGNRNHIVHWGQDQRVTFVPVPANAGVRVMTGKDYMYAQITTSVLTNNARKWRSDEKSGPSYSGAEINDCERKFRALKHVINRYWNSIAEPDTWPWTEIFQLPIKHRTPEEFLSLLNERGLPAQL